MFLDIKNDLVELNSNLSKALVAELKAQNFSKEEYEIARSSDSDYFKYIDFEQIDSIK